MTALIVLGWIVAYLLIGAVYARTNAVRYYQRRLAANQREYAGSTFVQRWASNEAKGLMAAAVFFWPVVALYDAAVGPLARWFTAPITNRREQAAGLRSDADRWDELRYSGTPQEREMASELARMCRDRANEVDL